ncbi:zinc finger protein 664-like [Phlebotomus argentipes]|uniref:zinc finger protein 664-like n=1 Tax=Phlebotomus argentipes TaxID=94469 RepID=UPI0028934994|nr:zinc finger protein 664-like [Phlebotomus argentipes]
MRNNLSFYTLKERIFLVKTFYKNESDLQCVKNDYFLEFGVMDDEIPDPLIFEVINLFEETGSVREIPEKSNSGSENITCNTDNFVLPDDIKVEPDIKKEEPEEESLNFDEPQQFVMENEAVYFQEVPKSRKIVINKAITGEKQESSAKRKRIRKRPVKTDEEFECEICQKILKTKFGLQSHIRRHAVNDECSCKYCGEMLPSSGELKVHTRERHPEKAGKSCSICAKVLKTNMNLKRHMLTHSEERTAICDVCGKGFKSRDSLNIHMRKHTGVKPFKCDYVGCKREFHEANSFAVHRRCHTGEKPYACEHCGKRFSDKGSLRVHYRQHTGENPYKCELCGKTTKQKQNLKSHMKHFHHINTFTNKTE